MTRSIKPVELYRSGGPDQLHTHLSIGFPKNSLEAESCGACAQLRNDFVWLRFNDAMARTLEDASRDRVATAA